MSYVRNAWYVAAWSHLEDRCVHRLAPCRSGAARASVCAACITDSCIGLDGTVAEVRGGAHSRQGEDSRSRARWTTRRSLLGLRQSLRFFAPVLRPRQEFRRERGARREGSAAYPEGTAEASKLQATAPELQGEVITFTSQAVTPLTGKTARYFFSRGPRKDQGDAALRDMLMGIAQQAFIEDRIMIAAQQRVIDETAA